MKLTTEQISTVRKMGLYIMEACDHCHKVLNQSYRYTILNDPRTWCSDACLLAETGHPDLARSIPLINRKCASCGKPFEAARSDARYCSQRCRKRISRRTVTDRHHDTRINSGPPEGKSVDQGNPLNP